MNTIIIINRLFRYVEARNAFLLILQIFIVYSSSWSYTVYINVSILSGIKMNFFGREIAQWNAMD